MSRTTGVQIEFTNNLAAQKSEWDSFLAYVASHQPTVNLGAPAGATTTTASATTFGGSASVAPPAAQAYGSAVVNAVAQASTQTVGRQSQTVSAGAAAQDLVSRLQQSQQQSSSSQRMTASPQDLGRMFGIAMAPSAALARTSPFQVGPNEAMPGNGPRTWVPVGDTPNVVYNEHPYGFGRRAMRSINAGASTDFEMPELEDGGGGGDDIGWSYVARGGRRGGGRGTGGTGWRAAIRRGLGAEGFRNLGRGLSAYQIAASVTDMLQSSNNYNNAMAGATSQSDVLEADKQAQEQNWMAQLPVVGPLGLAIREAYTGDRAAITRATTNTKLGDANANAFMGIAMSRNSFGARMQTMQGDITQNPFNILRGMQMESQAAIDNSRLQYQASQAIRQRDYDAIPESDKERRQLLRNGMVYAKTAQDQFEDQTGRSLEMQQNAYRASNTMQHIGVGLDVEDLSRDVTASAYEGRLMPRSAAMTNQITGYRRQVENFNLSHPGDSWKTEREEIEQQYEALQNQSFKNLQNLGNIPGNAQQVSGATFYGDFTNQGYKDYAQALQIAGGGADLIHAGAQTTGAIDDSSAQALVNALNAVERAIQQSISSGSGGW